MTDPGADNNGLKRPREPDDDGVSRKRITDNEEADDTEAARIFAEMEALQRRVAEIDAWQLEESLRIEQQALSKKEPVYAERSQLLERIDCFWQTALGNSPLRSQITDGDQELLSHLDTLVVSMPDAQGSYTISLTFEDNPILESNVITRTITKNPQDGSCHCVCSPIEWKQNLHEEDEWGMERLNAYIFLRWFVSEADFEAPGDEIAEMIRTAIWPNPVHFYTGGDDDMDLELEHTADPDDGGLDFVFDDGGDDDDDAGAPTLGDDFDVEGEPGLDAALDLNAGGDDQEEDDDDEDEDDADDADAL